MKKSIILLTMAVMLCTSSFITNAAEDPSLTKNESASTTADVTEIVTDDTTAASENAKNDVVEIENLNIYAQDNPDEFKGTFIAYRVCMQDAEKWSEYVTDSKESNELMPDIGITDIELALTDVPYDGAIEYRVYREDKWEEWKSFEKETKKAVETAPENEESTADTSVEDPKSNVPFINIEIKLSGEIAEHYSIQYKSHVDKWLGWMKDGALSGYDSHTGTIDCIQIQLTDKEGNPVAKETGQSNIPKNDETTATNEPASLPAYEENPETVVPSKVNTQQEPVQTQPTQPSNPEPAAPSQHEEPAPAQQSQPEQIPEQPAQPSNPEPVTPSQHEEPAPAQPESDSDQPAPVHEHTWVHQDAQYQTVHHDAVYNTFHHDAVYNTVHHDAVYETHYFCSACGAMDPSDEHFFSHGSSEYSDTIEVSPAYDEQVLVSDAYDEQVLVSDAYDEQVLISPAYEV